MRLGGYLSDTMRSIWHGSSQPRNACSWSMGVFIERVLEGEAFYLENSILGIDKCVVIGEA